MMKLLRALSENPQYNPWTNVYGVARSILALGTFLTLLVNNTDILFRPTGTNTRILASGTISEYSLFAMFPENYLYLAKLIALGILFIVIIGWRPRWSGILHWWIAFSFSVSNAVPDGGDQVTQIIALLLIPITITDTRKWHWSSSATNLHLQRPVAAVLGISSLFMVRIQMFVIYFHAAVAKFAVQEWLDGTVLYYWFTHPQFGFSEPVRTFLVPALSKAWLIVLLTWGSMLIETLLFMALVMEKKWYSKILVLGIAFHAMIIVVHGLPSFFFAMCAGLILYLRPVYQEFTFFRPKLLAETIRRWQKQPISTAIQ